MTEDMDVFFDADDFAVSVTYCPDGGTNSTIVAIMTELGPAQEAYERGFTFATAEIEVKAVDVATPQHGDTFTLGGKTWELDPESGVIYSDDYTKRIALRRREA